MGNLYRSQKQIEAAERYYLLALKQLKLQPNFYPAEITTQIDDSFFQLGNVYHKQDKLEFAKECFLLAKEKGNNIAIALLATIYQSQQRFDLAVEYFELAVEKGVENPKTFLTFLYYLKNKNKQKALLLITQLNYYSADDELRQSLLIAIRLWNGLINEALAELVNMIKENKLKYLKDSLEEMLIHHQTNAVMQLFENSPFQEKLMENYLPIYYALNILLKVRDIELKISTELQKTVNDIL